MRYEQGSIAYTQRETDKIIIKSAVPLTGIGTALFYLRPDKLLIILT